MDEGKGFISSEEPCVRHLKMEKYADYRSLGHMIRIVIFFAVFALVLTFATLTSSHGGLAFSSHSFEVYGWPQPWLHLDRIYMKAVVRTGDSVTENLAIAANGRAETERPSIHRIDWLPLVISAGAAGAIASVLLLPVFLWPRRSAERGGPTTGLS